MPMLLLCTIHAYVGIMYNTCLCCYYVQYMPMLLLCANVSTFFRRVVIIGPPIDAYKFNKHIAYFENVICLNYII